MTANWGSALQILSPQTTFTYYAERQNVLVLFIYLVYL